MSRRFKLILAVRFVGYLVFFVGLISFIFILGPLIGAEARYRADRILGIKRAVLPITLREFPSTGSTTSTGSAEFTLSEAEVLTTGSLGTRKPTSQVSGEGPASIIPVSTEYGIVIEKINANARIIAGVSPANEKEYVAVLTKGVAEALGSTPPGQPGNLYLFSHSTDAPWNIVRFNAIFYLLRELTPGDRVIIFYQNKRYDYIVFDKTIAKPRDVSYLTNKYDFPVLTLQTCDPPGTLLNRLIVRARLVSN